MGTCFFLVFFFVFVCINADDFGMIELEKEKEH